MDTPIRLVHGFLEPTLLLHGIHRSLKRTGFHDIKKISYPTYHRSLSSAIQKAEDRIRDSLSHPEQPVIVIGHSLGGVICSRLREINIVHSIMITSPLQGNYQVKWLRRTLGKTISKLITGRATASLDHSFITTPPPFPYHTISASLPTLDTDGVVKAKEMVIDERRNIHLHGIDHLSILFSDDLHRVLSGLLRDNLVDRVKI